MRKVSWAAIVAIAIPLVALFAPVLLTDRAVAMRDAAHFYHPLFQWCCREWAAGRVPLWNPYENCGVPALADVTSSVFYPGKLVFLLPVDFTLRYKLYVVGHVVLAAAGSYSLARAWKSSSSAAAVAAISFACGGSVVFQYSNIVFLVGAAWLPLAVLATDRMLRDRSLLAALLLGVILSLMILGGDPQVVYHCILIVVLYVVVLAASAEAAKGWWHSLGLLSVASAIAFLLPAVQILSSAEATKHSERAAFNRPRNVYEAANVALQPAGALQSLGETKRESILRGLFGPGEPNSHHDIVFDFSIGPWRLAEYFWPNIGGRMFPTNRRWMAQLPAEGRTWTPTLYLGLLPLLLALGSLRLWGAEARVKWLSWLVVIFTLGSFGLYGIGWIIHEVRSVLLSANTDEPVIGLQVGGVYWLMVTFLPTYVYFRYPAKLLTIVALGLSQLAAIGWDGAFSERRPRFGWVLVVFGVASGLGALIVLGVGPGIFGNSFRADPSLGPFHRSGAYLDVLTALVQSASVALGSWWLLRKAWSNPAQAEQWKFAALLLTAVELTVANTWLVATAPADLWRGEAPIASAVTASRESVAPARLFRGSFARWRPLSFAKSISRNRPAEVVEWERDTFFPKYHLRSGIALVESYGSVKLMDYESLLFVANQHGPEQPDGSRLPQPTTLRLLGTEYLLLPNRHEPAFAERVEASDLWPESAALWRMKRTLPRAWIVHQVETLPPLPLPTRVEAVDQRTKSVLFPGDKARDFQRSAVVETNEPLTVWNESTGAIESNELCQITHYDPQRVVVEAELSQPGLVVLSDAWYTGWRAFVTSAGSTHEAVIYRTNRVCRGVWIPAGRHTIEFHYQPASFFWGAAISASSWAALALLGLIALRGRKVKSSNSAPA